MMMTYRTCPARPEMMMDRMLRDFCGMPERRRPMIGFPVDVKKAENAYILTAELPGVQLENIDLTLQEDVLTIAAELGNVAKEERESYLIRERRGGRIERSFVLEGVDQAGITASCRDGLLTVVLPMEAPAEEKQPRRIAITGAEPQVVKLEAPAE